MKTLMEKMETLLLRRGYLLEHEIEETDKNRASYYAAKALSSFGVIANKPMDAKHLKSIADFYGKNIPNSFYANPQDTRHFSCDELMLEQLVSYFKTEFIVGVDSDRPEDFGRIELFKKVLPDYEQDDEITLRDYQVLSGDDACDKLKEIAKDLAVYTREWNDTEKEEFILLYKSNFFTPKILLKSKDNSINMFLETEDAFFAQVMDKKDVVKLSISMKGETSSLSFTGHEMLLLQEAISAASNKNIPLTKKQAKYYNTIVKKVNFDTKKFGKQTNIDSPYRLAKVQLDEGNVVEAAKIFAANGSLLERNLVWLLSRANPEESIKIIDMMKINNPLVSLQFLMSLLDQGNGARTFKFSKDELLKIHNETEYEEKWRKSIISQGVKNLLKDMILGKIEKYYASKESLGKIYLSEGFKKISLPFNTSASGTGLGVLPVGSRLPITEDYIRTFTYWDGPSDIDASASFEKVDGSRDILYWGSYSSKPFGDSALYSGDDRSSRGAEYQDFKISELIGLGYTKMVYTLSGYGSKLDIGKTYCGYQNKKDLNTEAWDPKNIAFKVSVNADSNAYIGFGIDLLTKEIIIINQKMFSDDRVINKESLKGIEQYMNSAYLNMFNMYDVLKNRGVLVDTPEEANVVFDSTYKRKDESEQKIIRPTDVEKLIGLLK